MNMATGKEDNLESYTGTANNAFLSVQKGIIDYEDFLF